MRIISEAECHSWVSAKLQEPFSWPGVERRHSHSVTYLLPTDVGKKTALARALTALVGRPGEGLLWITEWGVFPSCENMALFDGYRRSLRDERTVRAAPGHVFRESDLPELECLLDLVLYFFWDATVFDAGSIWLRISHDEVFSVHARERTVVTAWKENLARFELKELSSRTR